MKRILLRWWASLNYRHCRAEEYLATQRREILQAVGWAQLASDWNEEWNKWR